MHFECGEEEKREIYSHIFFFLFFFFWHSLCKFRAPALSQHAAEYFWVGMTRGEASRELEERSAVRVVAQGGVSEGRLRGIAALLTPFCQVTISSREKKKSWLLKRGRETHKWIKSKVRNLKIHHKLFKYLQVFSGGVVGNVFPNSKLGGGGTQGTEFHSKPVCTRSFSGAV